MKKLLIYSLLGFFSLACKEELPDYSFLDGYYKGGTQLSNSTLSCRGGCMKLNVFADNSVTIFIDCQNSGYYEDSYKTLFDGYHVGKSRVDSAQLYSQGNYYKVDVLYSLVDDKTNKEVGYFSKEKYGKNTRIAFRSLLLVSRTSKKDSLFDYYGHLK